MRAGEPEPPTMGSGAVTSSAPVVGANHCLSPDVLPVSRKPEPDPATAPADMPAWLAAPGKPLRRRARWPGRARGSRHDNRRARLENPSGAQRETPARTESKSSPTPPEWLSCAPQLPKRLPFVGRGGRNRRLRPNRVPVNALNCQRRTKHGHPRRANARETAAPRHRYHPLPHRRPLPRPNPAERLPSPVSQTQTGCAPNPSRDACSWSNTPAPVSAYRSTARVPSKDSPQARPSTRPGAHGPKCYSIRSRNKRGCWGPAHEVSHPSNRRAGQPGRSSSSPPSRHSR